MAGTKISLVLGSGGARGLAHIGVLRCLADKGFAVDYISGCSMGALVGGIYAAGKLDTFAEWVSALTRRDVVRLLDWSFSEGAVFKGERIIDELRSLIGDLDIESLEIGFTAVATDLNTAREVWFSEGSLWDAIRASIAVPLVFAPVERDGRTLVDGGLVNPVPIAPTFNSHAPLTFAVNLNGADEDAGLDESPNGSDDGSAAGEPGPRDADAQAEADERAQAQPGALAAMRAKIAAYVDRISVDLPAVELPTPQALELALRSMDAMQTSISRMKLAAYSPDVLIAIPRNLATFFEFHRAQALIDYGYRATEKALCHAGY